MSLKTFHNSINNKLQIDLSAFLSKKEVATRVDVYYNYDQCSGAASNQKPDTTRTRKPVQVYDDFTSMIGNDSRDPRNYIIEHVYNTTDTVTCRILVHTVEQTAASKDPHEILITVYGDSFADITSAFGKIDNDNNRMPGNGIKIHKAVAYTNEFGVEHILMMLRTVDPDYIAPVMLRLHEPVREQHLYKVVNDNVIYTNQIDTGILNMVQTSGEILQADDADTVYESGETSAPTINTTYTPSVPTGSTPTDTSSSPAPAAPTNDDTYYSY